MIAKPEDLSQKAMFIGRLQGTRWQGRPKVRWAYGVNSNSWLLEPQIGRIKLRIESNGKNFFDRLTGLQEVSKL
jgi:hypothetical protein